ncbi:hypothetical protein [Paenibacillus polymyxa]|uniref:hypothetical protein n=1 Tax=Paenibacillus polymyxa TaxID=1406 RepID=UPI001F3D13BA|nr:hypothetical protein [Paenibacillus polymyxa]
MKYYNEQHRTTIILTSHYMKDIEDLCKRTIIINDGRLVFDGDLKRIDDVLNDTKIIQLKFKQHVATGQLQFTEGASIDGFHARWR